MPDDSFCSEHSNWNRGSSEHNQLHPRLQLQAEGQRYLPRALSSDSLVPVSGNSGGFQATITETPAPPIVGSENPVSVPGNTNPILAGIKTGELSTPTSHVYDFAPLNA